MCINNVAIPVDIDVAEYNLSAQAEVLIVWLMFLINWAVLTKH